MAPQDGEDIRKAALPWYGEAVVATYQNAGAGDRYRDDFLRLIFEGYSAYGHGLLRASIIINGEALLRLLYMRIAQLLRQSGHLSVRQGRRVVTVDASSMHDLSDHLTFFQAQAALRNYLHAEVVERIDAVRFLRNRAAHGDLPPLDDWDPDDPRSSEGLMALVKGEIPVDEGYRFWKGSSWVTLAVRENPCNTLRGLSWTERLAVIQQLLVLSILPSFPGG